MKYAALLVLAVLIPQVARAADTGLQTGVYARAYAAKLRSNRDASGLVIVRARYRPRPGGWSVGAAYEYVTPGPFSVQPRTSTLLECYAAYENGRLQATIGNQFLYSPWANSHDVYGSAPAAFQGADVHYAFNQWSIEAAHMVRFHSPVDGSFSRTSLLGRTGGFDYLHLSRTPAHAAYTFDAYGYRMRDLATILWVSGSAQLGSRGWAPKLTVHGGFENSNGTANAGKAHSSILGFRTDLQPSRTIALQANFDAVYRGGWISPYSDGYAGDPLFTTALIDGMIDRRSAGTSEYTQITYTSLNQRFTVFSSYAWYQFAGGIAAMNETEWDTVGTYYFSPKGTGAYTGLLLRAGHLEQHRSDSASALHYSRIQVEYST